MATGPGLWVHSSFWPTMYLVDSDGFVRYKHIGEGAYDEIEAKIQELLAERDRIAEGAET